MREILRKSYWPRLFGKSKKQLSIGKNLKETFILLRALKFTGKI